jgi:hypothetical protein
MRAALGARAIIGDRDRTPLLAHRARTSRQDWLVLTTRLTREQSKPFAVDQLHVRASRELNCITREPSGCNNRASGGIFSRDHAFELTHNLYIH